MSEGLNLAGGLESTISDIWSAQGTLVNAADNSLGLPAAATDTSGKYVLSVGVAGGGLTITYGNSANAAINGQTLGLTPWVNNAGGLIWQCGNATAPAATTAPAGQGVPTTNILDRYLPSSCRTGA
ncbi:pilin [Methylomagnum ishizawai]|uniref:pilin n=1 Tax=Methylomagnum ishizawai TaxID=1760988 RepID=UPI0020CB6640